MSEPIWRLLYSGSCLYEGHLWSAQSGELTAELAQFAWHSDEGFRLETARSTVRGKLLNSKQLLLRLNRRCRSDLVTTAVEGINADWQAVAIALAGYRPIRLMRC